MSVARILDAAAFAAERHRMQRRKDAEASPYINHPLALARILACEGGVSDPVVLCAALLHDTIEDTDATPADILSRFGPVVAGVVLEVTDDKNLGKEERKRLQILKAPSRSRAAKLVKLADKIANLRDIAVTPPADWTPARRQAYFDLAKDVVDGLRGVSWPLERLFDEIYGAGPGGAPLPAPKAVGAAMEPNAAEDGAPDDYFATERSFPLAIQDGVEFRGIRLEFGKDGGIMVCGQDIGPSVERHFGDSEYEYGVEIPSEGLAKLLAALIRDRLGGDLNGVTAIQTLCQHYDVPHRFTTW